MALDLPEKWYEENLPHDNPEVGAGRPQKKHGFKYLFGVRHIRFFYWNFKLNMHINRCIRAGLGFFPQQSDLDHLQRICNGEA